MISVVFLGRTVRTKQRRVSEASLVLNTLFLSVSAVLRQMASVVINSDSVVLEQLSCRSGHRGALILPDWLRIFNVCVHLKTQQSCGGGGGVKIPLRLSIVQVILLSCVFAAHRMRRGQQTQLVPVRAA